MGRRVGFYVAPLLSRGPRKSHILFLGAVWVDAAKGGGFKILKPSLTGCRLPPLVPFGFAFPLSLSCWLPSTLCKDPSFKVAMLEERNCYKGLQKSPYLRD